VDKVKGSRPIDKLGILRSIKTKAFKRKEKRMILVRRNIGAYPK
jgi:hypothetical protein